MKGKIFVTGGTGYIGSHTTVELLNRGYEVVIVDNLSNSTLDVLDGIKKITGKSPLFEQFDICDFSSLKTFFEKHSDISATIHFAASKAVGESVQKPLLYYRNNLQSLLNLLELHVSFGIANFVFSSSCTVYGEPDSLPVTEKDPVKPANSPYGNTKQIAEEILADTIVANSEFKSIALRYFNPIGAHESAEIGELPNGVPNNLIPFLTQTVAGLREKLSVFGNDYNTPDGSCIRDYINVVDLAKAHVIAIERLLNNRNKQPFEVFNLGTGNGVSVLEIISAFERVNGINVPYEIVDRRAGDVEQVWADTSFANRELGWKADISLEDTLASAWKWQKRITVK